MTGRRLAPALAVVTSSALLIATYLGSAQLQHFDPALSGYFGATLVACFALTYRVVLFWSRPPSAFFGRTLAAALTRPQLFWAAARTGATVIVAQTFVHKRSTGRWLAHLALSWGTLVAFAVTVPLVCGWMRFEAAGERHYVALFVGFSTLRFDADGVVGWLIFHVLSIAAVAVIAGCSYFVWQRLRQHATALIHMAPLFLLLSVAVSGLLLIPAARAGAWVLPAAQLLHQMTVVALLIALAFSKLIHLFIRPLHLGVRLLRAQMLPMTRCRACSREIVVAAQFAAVQATLVRSGFRFDGYQSLCPLCRRRQVALQQTAAAVDRNAGGGGWVPRARRSDRVAVETVETSPAFATAAKEIFVKRGGNDVAPGEETVDKLEWNAVTPAKAGGQRRTNVEDAGVPPLDPGLRRDDTTVAVWGGV